MKKVINVIGQSTAEFLIVFTAVIAVMLYAATTWLKPSVNDVYRSGAAKLTYQANLFQAVAGSPGTNATTNTTTETGAAGTGTSCPAPQELRCPPEVSGDVCRCVSPW